MIRFIARPDDDVRVVEVGGDIQTKDQLIQLLRQELEFPEYASNNWDSLDECLNDLSWLMESVIVVSHQEWSTNPLAKATNYGEIIRGATDSHQKTLLFVFEDSSTSD